MESGETRAGAGGDGPGARGKGAAGRGDEARAGAGASGAELGARLRAGDRAAAPAALNLLETRTARDAGRRARLGGR